MVVRYLLGNARVTRKQLIFYIIFITMYYHEQRRVSFISLIRDNCGAIVELLCSNIFIYRLENIHTLSRYIIFP